MHSFCCVRVPCYTVKISCHIDKYQSSLQFLYEFPVQNGCTKPAMYRKKELGFVVDDCRG